MAMDFKWDLRPGARQGLPPPTWIDCDPSGNYDPAEERRRVVTRKRKTNNQTDDQIVSTAEEDNAPFIICLSLKSQQGRGFLASLEHKSNPFLHFPLSLNSNLGIVDPAGTEMDLTGHPAARGCCYCRENGFRCSRLDDASQYPCLFCQHDGVFCQLIIPPKYKQACEPCKTRGIICSYSSDETQSEACHQCKQVRDTNPTQLTPDCVAAPIPGTLPVRTSIEYTWEHREYVSCDGCRNAKKKCSLKSKSDNPPCKNCINTNEQCTFQKSVRTKKQKVNAMPPPFSRELILGVQNQENEIYDPTSVDNCELRIVMLGHAMDRENIEAQNRTDDEQRKQDESTETSISVKAVINEPVASHHTSRPQSPLISRPVTPPPCLMKDNSGNSGYVTTFFTSLCHPITFGSRVKSQSERASQNCDWCTGLAYGILGLGRRSVYAIKWRSGLGYTELMDGHIAEGKGSSRICEDCTLARMQIILCETHSLRRLPKNDSRPDSKESLIESLIQDVSVVTKDDCCSLCVSPASHGCATRQHFDKYGYPVEEQEQHKLSETIHSHSFSNGNGGNGVNTGCGLRLCLTCAEEVKTAGGDLQGTVATAVKEEQDGVDEFKWRADVALLDREGLLLKNVLAYGGMIP